jgi:hypothetical protein
MVFKGNLDIDPRGMIYESYRIDGISVEECRMIFLYWALEAAQVDMREKLQILLNEYGDQNPDHPMTSVILEGMKKSTQSGRRGGASGRR